MQHTKQDQDLNDKSNEALENCDMNAKILFNDSDSDDSEETVFTSNSRVREGVSSTSSKTSQTDNHKKRKAEWLRTVTIVEVDHESENQAEEEREYIEMIPNINISSLKEVEMQDDYFAQTTYSKLAIAGIYKDTSQMTIKELKEAHTHTKMERCNATRTRKS